MDIWFCIKRITLKRPYAKDGLRKACQTLNNSKRFARNSISFLGLDETFKNHANIVICITLFTCKTFSIVARGDFPAAIYLISKSKGSNVKMKNEWNTFEVSMLNSIQYAIKALSSLDFTPERNQLI